MISVKMVYLVRPYLSTFACSQRVIKCHHTPHHPHPHHWRCDRTVTAHVDSRLGFFIQVGAEGPREGSEDQGGGWEGEEGYQKTDERMKDEPPDVQSSNDEVERETKGGWWG